MSQGPRDGTRATPILGAVLAGGLSRRFGRDKTAAEVDGITMMERAVAALRGECDDVVVVSSREDTPEGPWRTIPDLREGRGPLAGIEAALVEAGRLWGEGSPPDGRISPIGRTPPDGRTSPAVLVLAADLPLVGTETVRRLIDAYRRARPPAAAVAARREGDPPFEPLCAVYSVACKPAVAALLDAGHGAAWRLLEAVEGETVDIGSDVASVNVNTTEDRVRAEAWLRAGEERT